MELSLTSALKQNSTAALEEAYSIHHAQLYSFIYHKTQSAYLAEEVVQLTFIRLWKQRDQLKENVALQIQLFGPLENSHWPSPNLYCWPKDQKLRYPCSKESIKGCFRAQQS
ncbi:hypothetical protein LPB86_08690 [Pedobacter sp. MC2016-14]|uniref:RNA polymerase sigma factor n=1 Tax=Pedobacter sp. MC2016-14 TaxID=2897327 RepID=UPI001E4CD6D8|nr:sigma factor [Pedobacter sp. MC2016-14]MCD0488304.1 hypothetical protein [Pedobacter sp. MC2016-14]